MLKQLIRYRVRRLLNKYNDTSNLIHRSLLYFPGSSSRKLAKTLEPRESDRGHLEIAPTQSIEKNTSSTSSQSFIRDEAPHTTRIPAPLWNKRRRVESFSRWSSDRRGEPEGSVRDRGGERVRMSERYRRDRRFGDREAGKESEKGFRDRGGERDRVSERYSQERRFGDRQAGREPVKSFGGERDRVSERYSQGRRSWDRQAGRGPESFHDRGGERDGASERYSQQQRFGDRQAGRESEKSFHDRGGERDKVSERHSREQTFGDRQAGRKVAQSEDDTRHLAYKQYLERRDSRSSGMCSVSCHKFAKDLTLMIDSAPRFTPSFQVGHTKWS